MTSRGSAARSDRIRALFDEVVGLNPEERVARLAEACGDDEELRREVESLLEAADARGSGVRRALEGLQPPEEEADQEPSAPGEIPTALQSALADRYRIVRELGRGGMATVYLADDLKHNRQVAVKVLRPELAAVVGAKRFLAEIETTANLQHPHILPLFDSGEADGVLFYVMPYVEGESLRQKLDQERQLAVPDAVAIATKVSSALNYAHRHGVIHRDIKPANILLHDGEPVVTDFGIALAVRRGREDRLTETGLSLGTPHYMSPEQATGDHHVGPATDVYALGCVLYEMLAGEPPYTGSTPQAVLGKVITGGAESVSGLRASVPPNVEAAITRALERIPADRFATARRFAEALEDPAFRHRTEGQAGPSAAPDRRRGRERSAWAAILFVVVVVGAWGWLRPGHTHDVVRMTVELPMAGGGAIAGAFAVSPDGGRMAYISPTDEGLDGVWYRDLDVLQPTAIDAPGNVRCLAWSPDGSQIAFHVERVGVFTASLQGEVPVRIAEPPYVNNWFIAWGPDGWIYAEGSDGLIRVPASGNTGWEPVTQRRPNETRHVLPDPLPGGRGVVFSIRGPGGDSNSIGVLDLVTGEHRALLPGVGAVYSDTGHLVYVTAEGVLSAVPFDADRLEVKGEPRVLTGGVRVEGFGLWISRNGSLLYMGEGGESEGAQLVWVARDGSEEPVDSTWIAAFRTVALAPSGDRVAVSIVDRGTEHVWLRSLEGGALQRVSHAGGRNWRPSWRRDGRALAYISDQAGPLRAFVRPTDLSRPDEEILPSADGVEEIAWFPDGARVVLRRGGGISGGDRDVMASPVGGAELRNVAATEADERTPSLSPDGRWLAYRSDASIVVRSISDGEATWQIASGDIRAPLWSPAGDEIFYRDEDLQSMVAVQVETDPTFSVVGRQHLFDTTPYRLEANGRAYDATSDGQRFLMIRERPSRGQLVWVQNFAEELKRLVPR